MKKLTFVKVMLKLRHQWPGHILILDKTVYLEAKCLATEEETDPG